MAQQYDPRKVLKHISKDYLKLLFEKAEANLELDWDAVVQGKYEAVYDAWRKLPSQKNEQIEAVLGQVDYLATSISALILRDTLEFAKAQAVPDFDSIDGLHDRALWVHLYHPNEFIEATLFTEADEYAKGRYWDKRADLPKLSFTYDERMNDALAQQVRLYFMSAQGRGNKVFIEHYERSAGRHYFFAYVQDFSDFDVSLTDDSPGERVATLRHFETFFVYTPDEQVLEIRVKGGKKVVTALAHAFGEAVLGIPLGPPPSNAKSYNLELLKDGNFNFVTEPQDGIKEIRVRYLKFDIVGYYGRRITLESPADGNLDEIYTLIRNYLNPEIPLEKLQVSQARIQMRMHPVEGKTRRKGKTYSLELSRPYRSNLKSKSDLEQNLWGKYLRKWGIDS